VHLLRTCVRDPAGKRRFKRALERRNFLLAWTLAAELPKVPLADALSLLLQPWRFETAAPRWHARLCDEARLTLAEAQLAVSALDAMAGPGAVAGGQALFDDLRYARPRGCGRGLQRLGECS
jgi:hypothetical protein